MRWKPNRQSALEQIEQFLPKAGRNYANTRNFDDGRGRANVSLLSPWLHAGIISEAELCEKVLGQHSSSAADKFISEIFWRIYFKGYLEQRPSIWQAYMSGRDDAFQQLADNSEADAAYREAVEGRTGIEAFDHWALELVETGYLHNHSRMWFASIWMFTLKLDWHLGADFFLRHLLDGDAASNTLSWRWVAGLHTKGKTYLARPGNISRYTPNLPGGPLQADELATGAEPLVETAEHARQSLALPPPAEASAFEQPYALLLHDEAASHVPLALPQAPALVIGAARPEARSNGAVGDLARKFAQQAVVNGVEEAVRHFDCPSIEWSDNTELATILAEHGLDLVAYPYLPTGWTRDALWPELTPLNAEGKLIALLSELDRATWPHAKAGFFGVKKQINRLLEDVRNSECD